MADMTVVSAEVLPEATTRMIEGIAGATILGGELVYLDTTTNTYKLADSNAALTSVVAGIAMNSVVAGQAMRIAQGGAEGTTLDPGFTVTPGAVYFLSSTAGKIKDTLPASTEFPVVIGVGITASQLKLGPFIRGTVAVT